MAKDELIRWIRVLTSWHGLGDCVINGSTPVAVTLALTHWFIRGAVVTPHPTVLGVKLLLGAVYLSLLVFGFLIALRLLRYSVTLPQCLRLAGYIHLPAAILSVVYVFIYEDPFIKKFWLVDERVLTVFAMFGIVVAFKTPLVAAFLLPGVVFAMTRYVGELLGPYFIELIHSL